MIDAYTIGVSIALSNGVSAILAVIQKDVLGLKRAVDLTQGSFDRMKVAAFGFSGVVIGGAMIAGLSSLSKAGEKYVHQLEQMKLAGMSLEEQQRAIFAANQVSSRVLTTDPTGNLQAIRELRGALNSAGASPAAATHEAIEHLEAVQKAQAVMVSSLGSDHASDVYEMVKGLEQIGATQNPERFNRLLDGMVRANVAFGGKLNATQWFQTLKYTRGAGQFYDDEFLQFYLPTLMQEMSAGKGMGQGGGPGNALASLYQVVAGGAIGNKAAQEWLKMGLLDPEKIIRTRTGSIKGVMPGGIVGSELAIHNPAKWVQEFLLPHFQQHHIDTNTDRAEELARMFPNRTSQQMIGLLSMVRKMEGDRKLIEGAMHMDPAFAEAIRKDPVLTRKAAEMQWDRIKTDLGKAITPAVNEMIFRFAEGLSKVAELIERHPVATKWILGFVAALGALLAIGGTIALAIAAFAALGSAAWIGAISAAILGFAAAIAGMLSLVDWAAFGAWAHNIGHWFAEIARTSMHWVQEIIASLKHDIISLWTGAAEALLSFVHKLRDWVNSLLGVVRDAIRGLNLFGRAPPSNDLGLPGVPSGTTDPNVHTQSYHPPAAQHPPPAAIPTSWMPGFLPGPMGPRGVPGQLGQPGAPGQPEAAPHVQRASYVPPQSSGSRQTNQQVGYVYVINGRDIADGTARWMADRISRPPASATRFDPAMTPAFQPLRA